MSNITPAQIVHRFCNKNSYKFMFNMIKNGTRAKNPIFIYELYVIIGEDKIRAVASGKSKINAKHAVSIKVLEELASRDLYSGQMFDKSIYQVTDTPQQPCPISSLSNFCEEHRLPSPVYELGDTIRRSHPIQFEMICRVADYQVKGVSTNKKSAKRLSAENMMYYLCSLSSIDIESCRVEHITNIQLINEYYKKLHEQVMVKDLPDDPFYFCDKKLCKLAINALEENSLSEEEKTKKALEVLKLEYTISESTTIINTIMYVLSFQDKNAPEFCVAEDSMEKLFKKVNEYMIVLLS